MVEQLRRLVAATSDGERDVPGDDVATGGSLQGRVGGGADEDISAHRLGGDPATMVPELAPWPWNVSPVAFSSAGPTSMVIRSLEGRGEEQRLRRKQDLWTSEQHVDASGGTPALGRRSHRLPVPIYR